jgi:hypothetical protein
MHKQWFVLPDPEWSFIQQGHDPYTSTLPNLPIWATSCIFNLGENTCLLSYLSMSLGSLIQLCTYARFVISPLCLKAYAILSRQSPSLGISHSYPSFIKVIHRFDKNQNHACSRHIMLHYVQHVEVIQIAICL